MTAARGRTAREFREVNPARSQPASSHSDSTLAALHSCFRVVCKIVCVFFQNQKTGVVVFVKSVEIDQPLFIFVMSLSGVYSTKQLNAVRVMASCNTTLVGSVAICDRQKITDKLLPNNTQ